MPETGKVYDSRGQVLLSPSTDSVDAHETASRDPQPALSSTCETRVDTSTDKVELLAAGIGHCQESASFRRHTATLLRALVTERDAERSGRIEAARLAAETADRLGEMRAQRDALLAVTKEVINLRNEKMSTPNIPFNSVVQWWAIERSIDALPPELREMVDQSDGGR